jgi:hypothetical protein
LTLGRALLEQVRDDPAQYDKLALALDRKLEALPVADVGARLGFQADIGRLRGFGARKVLAHWGQEGLDGGKTVTTAFSLGGRVAQAMNLRLLFLPTAGPHFLKVHTVVVKDGERELAVHANPFDVREGAAPVELALDVATSAGPARVEFTWQGPGGNQLGGEVLAAPDLQPDFGRAVGVGGWGKEQFDWKDGAPPWQEVQVADLTSHLKGPGPVFLEARYSSYSKGMFGWLKLLKNGQEIDADIRAGDSRAGEAQRRWRLIQGRRLATILPAVSLPPLERVKARIVSLIPRSLSSTLSL